MGIVGVKPGRVLFSEDQIRARIKELGKQISEDYKEKEIILVGILKGACFFLVDLAREIKTPLKFDFMSVSSYGAGTETSGVVKILKDLDFDLGGQHILLVEDIIDTGLTLKYLVDNLYSRRPASLKICTLLDKFEKRKVDIKPDYRGFIIPNHFVVGYGLDYNQYFRELPYIAVLEHNYAFYRLKYGIFSVKEECAYSLTGMVHYGCLSSLFKNLRKTKKLRDKF